MKYEMTATRLLRRAVRGGFVVAVVATTFIAVSQLSLPGVQANGASSPIQDGVVGPYEYVVGIWPPRPAVGNLFMTITLSADGKGVSNAVVDVEGGPRGQPPSLGPLPVNNDFTHPNTYELDVSLARSGEWVFRFMIRAPMGAEEVETDVEGDGEPAVAGQTSAEPKESQVPTVAFTEPEESSSTAVVAVVAVSLLVLAVGIGVWAVRRGADRGGRNEVG